MLYHRPLMFLDNYVESKYDFLDERNLLPVIQIALLFLKTLVFYSLYHFSQALKVSTPMLKCLFKLLVITLSTKQSLLYWQFHLEILIQYVQRNRCLNNSDLHMSHNQRYVVASGRLYMAYRK